MFQNINHTGKAFFLPNVSNNTAWALGKRTRFSEET